MRRTKTLALWAILCCGSLSGRAEVDSFTIRSPAAVGRIEVRYFLAGAFGGYGGFVRDSDEDGAYRIPLEQDGRMGTNLKAILYAQGCRFTILFSGFALRFNTEPRRSVVSHFPRSPSPEGSRRLGHPPGLWMWRSVIFSLWDHTLFGFNDGMTQGFNVGKAPLKPGGRFQIQISDFQGIASRYRRKTHSWRSS